jgi:hypothetical protein
LEKGFNGSRQHLMPVDGLGDSGKIELSLQLHQNVRLLAALLLLLLCQHQEAGLEDALD